MTLAYYVHDENILLNFYVFDPDSKIIYKERKKNKGFYKFNTSKIGEYSYKLESFKGATNVQVTFASHLDDHSQSFMNSTHVDSMEQKITKTYSLMKDVHFNSKMVVQKMNSHFTSAKVHNSKITTFAIIETIFMVVILFGQSYYIRSLIKRM